MKKLSFILGTRPEIIKLAPLIKLFREQKLFKVQVIFTNQHPDLGIKALKEFGIVPDHILDIKRNSGDLNELQAKLMSSLHSFALIDKRPNLVIVQGDTMSAFAGALFAYQSGIKIAHIEAGLRAKVSAPFPEEFYRQSISKMATYHFTPSKREFLNLVDEGINSNKIFITGNAILDTLPKFGVERRKIENSVLITIHRRETKFLRTHIFAQILQIALEHVNYRFKFLIHPSNEFELNELPVLKNVEIMRPMNHGEFIHEMCKSKLVLTDSGGVQEELAALGIAGIVLRVETERMDGLGENIELLDPSQKSLGNIISEKLLEAKARETKTSFYGPSQMIYNQIKELELIKVPIIC